MKNFSRRTFLKLFGATAALATAGAAWPRTVRRAAGSKVEGPAAFKTSICEMCTARCPIKAKVVDGKMTVIEGNPKWGSTGGTLCARGVAGQSLLYDPQRLKKPMIRTGQRGEGKWKEVSWEEAYGYIGQKLQEIKAQHGPESVAFASRSGLHTSHFFNFARAYGSPNTFLHDSTCPLSRDVALNVTFGTPSLNMDYANVKYFLSLGRSYFEGINVAHARQVMAAIQKGAKLVVADPRFSATAAKAHEWYPIKPGTDLALVLAINHVLIRDGLFDQAFIEKYTVGFDQVKSSIGQYTPQWAEQETGIRAADIERIAREMAAAKPRAIVDWGWRTCTTTEEFELRRASIITNLLLGAFEVPGGMYLRKNAGFINGMAGKAIALGLKSPKLPAYPKPARPRVDGAGVKGHANQFVMPGSGVVHQMADFILDGKSYPIKGWFVYRNNPLCTHPDSNRLIEAVKKLDLMVVCDVYMSDTAWYADVVLPESTYLERDEGFNDASGSNPVYTLRQQVIEPLHDTKPHWQIFKELGEKIGLGAYFPWKDIEEFRLIQLGGRADLLQKAKEEGFVSAGLKALLLRDKSSVAQLIKQFPELQSLVNEQGLIEKPLLQLKTPSKKIELFSEAVEQAFPGRGVPVYRPVSLKKDDELFFIQGKIAIHTNGASHNVPWLHNLMPANRLWIHPDTAKKLTIADGDAIEMTSAVASQKVRAFITQAVRPDTVFAYFGFGRLSPGLKRAYKQGVNAGMMLPLVTANVGAVNVHTTGVTIKKVSV